MTLPVLRTNDEDDRKQTQELPPVGIEVEDRLESGRGAAAVVASLASNTAVTQQTDSPPLRSLDEYRSFSGSSKARVIEWNIMEYKVRLRKRKTRTILRNIVGRAKNGNFTAIIGPSGSGKTSLLDCLSLRNSNFTGCLRLNGGPLTKEFFMNTGYVHQKELFFQHLTVREHLIFHAINRLGCIRSTRECENRVDQVIEEVDLTRVADSRVGGGAFYITKGLSGGERKRLNIATELLADPSILLLDEPTSGLDSVMGELICLLLKSLAVHSPQRIIITALHSPSSRLFMLFTHVILLTSRGESAYWGRREDLLPFLDRLGYRCPTQFNPADFALELASVKIIKTPEFANAQSDEAKWPANHPFEESEVNNNVNGHMLIASNSAPRLVDACNQMLARTFETLEVNDRHKEMQGGKGAKASIFTLIRTNLWRSWMQQNRELSGLIVSTIMNALLGLVFGLLYYDEISRDSGRNTAGFLFSLVVTLLISSSIQVCLHFPMDFTILMREYYVGANTPVPYFLGRTIASIPYSLVSLLMGIIPYWMTGLARDAPSFGYFCLVLFFLIFGAQSIGYLASSFTSNPVVGLAILPLLITPMILFSGMLYERNTVRPTLKWMQDLSLINYSFALLVLNQVRRVHGPAQAFLMAFLQVQPSDWTTYLIELTCLAFGYRVLAMIVLMFKVRYFSQAH